MAVVGVATLLVSCLSEKIVEQGSSVNGLVISQSVAVLTPGSNLQLMAVVLPIHATRGTVNWLSSNPAVATVSDGLVTAVAEGRTTIMVNADYGNSSASCSVVVSEATPTVIVMQQSGKESVMIEVSGTGTTTVEWGDGTSDETQEAYHEFTHTYTGSSSRTITIIGEHITQVSCGNNGITSLNISENNTLTSLTCFGNRLTSLDVRHCSALSFLFCDDNELTSLQVSGCGTLVQLWCYNNKITSLDVNDCGALKKLWCYNNEIHTLEIENCFSLVDIDCCDNKLGNLDLTTSPLLQSLRCKNNMLLSAALNVMFESLHGNPIEIGKSMFIDENPGAGSCNRSIATKKGWVFY
jgi:Leucine-rich repeat (LRR) protein